MRTVLSGCVVALALATIASSQSYQDPRPADPQPIYRVTVVSRTLPAVNYQHMGGPTNIDFRGTILLPQAKGFATVESKRGRVQVDARFEHLDPPTRFGREYLTYVLWAITPEGRPKNIGELLANSSDKSKIAVTTDLQAFGLMVTAEPYYAVTTPSDVVVLENVIRPDTIGRIEPVIARYDLLPRGQYTMSINGERLRTVGSEPEKLSYDRYEAVLELYQAQNAVQIAQSVGADRYAPDAMRKAEDLLSGAQNFEARRQDTHTIVSRAREAAQIAEDARAIAVKRAADEQALRAQEQNGLERARRERAQAEAAQAQANAEAAQAAADRERAAADRAAEVDQAQEVVQVQTHPAAPPPIQAQPVPAVAPELSGTQRRTRVELLDGLNKGFYTRDTPRGLVVVIPDAMFDGETLRRPASERLGLIASYLTAHPNLTISVEGFTDDRGSDVQQREVSERRAREVRAALVGNGISAVSVHATGMGKDRAVASNASAGGRTQNRRVEIVIAGPSIGAMPLWDRTYKLNSTR